MAGAVRTDLGNVARENPRSKCELEEQTEPYLAVKNLRFLAESASLRYDGN